MTVANHDPAGHTDGDRPAEAGNADTFPIVAIGASAGGLHAFESFFDTLPPEPGMAFVSLADDQGENAVYIFPCNEAPS